MNRNRRYLVDEDSDGDDSGGWKRAPTSTTNRIVPRRNGVSRDPLAEIRAILEDDWREILDENFHPITLALDMLDTSSLGRHRELGKFKKTNQLIEQALQSTVNEHYQGFNSSIGTYGQVTGSIKQSQRQIISTKESLLRAKVQLSVKRSDLLDMSTKSQQYKDIIKLLRDAADLKKIPEELESHLSSKRFLHAVELLNTATSTANREDLLQIAALNDVRQYLKIQAVSFVEILVEELHNHLYLKSPYCDARWASYVPGQIDLPVVHTKGEARNDDDNMRQYSSMGRLAIEAYRAKGALSGTVVEVLDDQHPESDSFRYTRILTEALYAIGKLPYALDLMIQRLPFEVHQIVERTIGEVRNRHREFVVAESSTIDPLSADPDDHRNEPLKDLLWTLFSKWDAMLQSHRVLYDSVGHMQDRSAMDKRGNNQASSVGYDFIEIWKPLESELRAILNDYLTEKSNGTQSNLKEEAPDDLFGSRRPRDKSAAVFSILHVSSNIKDSTFAGDETELRQMLQGSVPGLLPEKNELTSWTSSHGINDEAGEQHTQLCPASPFNISTLLQPTIAFLTRAKRVIPISQALTPSGVMSFLDEFLENVFAPQISDSVEELYKSTVASNSSGFSATGVTLKQQGISSNTAKLLDLILRLSSLLSTIPYNREGYAHTILRIISHNYQQSHALLMSLTANEHADDGHLGALKLGAAWAHRPILKDLWTNYFSQEHDTVALHNAASEETRALRELKKGFVIRPQDLMQDVNGIECLILLYISLKHFATAVMALRPEAPSMACGPHLLQMSSQTMTHFDTLIKSHQQLSNMILLILRIEIRCHVLYYLQLSLGQGNYNIEEPANEVDGFLADLNSDLLSVCQPASTLSEQDYNFVMTGLADLVDSVLIEDSDQIIVMSKEGASKLSLGIASIQQNLRNLIPDPGEADLSRARRFYEMFSLGPLGLADAAGTRRDFDLDFGQASKLMKLQYSIDLEGVPGNNPGNNTNTNNSGNNSNEPSSHGKVSRGTRDSVSGKKKQLNEHLNLLQKAMSQRSFT